MNDVIGSKQYIAGLSPLACLVGHQIGVNQVTQNSLHLNVPLVQRANALDEYAVTNELSHKTRSGTVIQVIGVVPLVQMPFFNDTNDIANGESLHLVVRDKQCSGVGSFQNLANFKSQAFAQIDIEVGKRLVQQQEFGFGCQGSGQGHALLLTARELVRESILHAL